jgi:hypothetical protein
MLVLAIISLCIFGLFEVILGIIGFVLVFDEGEAVGLIPWIICLILVVPIVYISMSIGLIQ